MNPPIPPRGADALVHALQLAGVQRVFTLSGNHIMSIFDAAIGSGIELVHTRHEASAVHMADAWSRIRAEVGVALVTGGPGHANAIAALYTAQMAEAPVVLLSGHAPTHQLGRGAFQEMRQADLAAPFCKASWTCARAQDLALDLARAVRIALSGRPGPVHLSLPVDLLEQRLEAFVPPAASDFLPEAVPPTAAVIQALAARLGQAARPLVLVGPHGMTRSARRVTQALEEESGVPVVGMESPRGLSDASLGAFPEILGQADCVVLVGKRVDFTLGFGGAIADTAQVFQIDPDEAELARTRQALGDRLGIAVRADALPALRLLTPALAARAEHAWRAEVRQSLSYRPPAWERAGASAPDRLHPVQMLRTLQAVLDSHPDSVLVCDGGEIGQWAMACLTAPHRVNNGVAGAIGAGLPYALAAGMARPGAPVIAVMGDGTVGFHIAEFDTAVRHALAMVVVVGNDARWNAEYQIQLREYGRDRAMGCGLRESRYDLVATALGARGEQITDPGRLAAALGEALAAHAPTCLNVLIEGVPAPRISRQRND